MGEFVNFFLVEKVIAVLILDKFALTDKPKDPIIAFLASLSFCFRRIQLVSELRHLKLMILDGVSFNFLALLILLHFCLCSSALCTDFEKCC